MRRFVMQTVLGRMRGRRPGPPRAAATATALGGVAAVLTYRLLRHETKR